MNKLLSLLLVLLFTQSCSFKPMLADKSYNFKFVNIKFEGDRNINQILNQELKDISKGKKEYDIYFKTKKNKEIVSSNAKGDPEKSSGTYDKIQEALGISIDDFIDIEEGLSKTIESL